MTALLSPVHLLSWYNQLPGTLAGAGWATAFWDHPPVGRSVNSLCLGLPCSVIWELLLLYILTGVRWMSSADESAASDIFFWQIQKHLIFPAPILQKQKPTSTSYLLFCIIIFLWENGRMMPLNQKYSYLAVFRVAIRLWGKQKQQCRWPTAVPVSAQQRCGLAGWLATNNVFFFTLAVQIKSILTLLFACVVYYLATVPFTPSTHALTPSA